MKTHAVSQLRCVLHGCKDTGDGVGGVPQDRKFSKSKTGGGVPTSRDRCCPFSSQEPKAESRHCTSIYTPWATTGGGGPAGQKCSESKTGGGLSRPKIFKTRGDVPQDRKFSKLGGGGVPQDQKFSKWGGGGGGGSDHATKPITVA